MKLIESTGIDLRGKHAVVIGRSNIVGKPMALLLLQAERDRHRLPQPTRRSRRAHAAAPTSSSPPSAARNTLTADMVKPGAVVIDVGMNRNAAGKLCGDVDFAGVAQVAGAITPVPGGVGPMTIAMLLVEHRRRRRARRRRERTLELIPALPALPSCDAV